jgi:nucleotidyltransferase substrate binding protein (TIGR01987 family)
MSLDLTHFSNAIARLQEAMALYALDPSQTVIRDGLIQRFEFTYELAHRTLKRALQAASASPDQYERMSFGELIRSGNEQGVLLSEWPQWKAYREMRGKTSHTYDEAVALEVVAGIAGFMRDAVFLHDRLRERQI